MNPFFHFFHGNLNPNMELLTCLYNPVMNEI